jgi:GNAT superfamily N-acetyltransferase
LKEIELEVFHGLSLNIILDGRRIGFIDAWEDKAIKGGVWVEYLYILASRRGSGIGSEAMKRAITRWGEMGYSVISLDDVHWERPEGFWEKLGFRGEGKRKRLRIADAPW